MVIPMVNFDTTYYTLYKQALEDPSQLSEDDLLNIIVRYPYSQPLLFAYERRKKLMNEDSPNKELALLYAPNSNWLWDFVNKPIEVVEELIPEQEDYIPYVELTSEEDDHIVIEDQATENLLSESTDTVHGIHNTYDKEEALSDETNNLLTFDFASTKDLPNNQLEEELMQDEVSIIQSKEGDSPDTKHDDLETLLQSGGIAGDYFLFDKKKKEEVLLIDKEEAAAIELIDERKKERDNISLYNDDLMPYSFRWWLHKTRLEYAETYQPFAVAFAPYRNVAPVYMNAVEKTILDQQIKENIIHLQDPESKLSEEVLNREIETAAPKKSDPIIERFIKEEPIIQPPAPANLNNENMARQSAEDNYVFVTETLAKIYEDQGLSLKAIEVFKKLILKYPEKKSYFVHRIQELEKNL